MIIVKTFSNRINAGLAADYLRQHNVDCFIADEYSSAVSIIPNSEIRVMVDERDLNRAKAILAEFAPEL